MQYRPSQIKSIESIRTTPFGTMFGCCEFECCAEAIVKWLIENGDAWTTKLPNLAVLCGKNYLVHAVYIDGKYQDEYFEDYYVEDVAVNQLFIDTVHRGYDCEFRSDILKRLFPEEFGDAQ
jgi:hypothetical protein